ncbi:MAG: hypothetical protein OEW25_00990 [Nitrospira sp.]|nr:hypothetical protein [Nitrospira sp.]MDH5251873.1 hypothetical protein [Nitrospira sp.]
MTITLKITVNGMNTQKDLDAFCKQLAEQIVELPLNSDCAIQRIYSSYPKKGDA